MNQQEENTNEKKIGKNITFCVKCQSDNISVNDKEYVCHNCGIKGTFEWYENSKQ